MLAKFWNLQLKKLAYRKAQFKDDVITGTIGLIIVFLIDFYKRYPCTKFGSYNVKDEGVTAGGNTPQGWLETEKLMVYRVKTMKKKHFSNKKLYHAKQIFLSPLLEVFLTQGNDLEIRNFPYNMLLSTERDVYTYE